MLVTTHLRSRTLCIPAFDGHSPANNRASAEQPQSFIPADRTFKPILLRFRNVLSIVDIVGEDL